jgi:HEAT repeat protein
VTGPVDQSREIKSAQEVCRRLYQAYRDLRLYPRDHPTVRGAFDRLLEVLDPHLETTGALALEVEEDRLLCGGEEVYVQDAGRDNLAFVMFRDGVRALTFHQGMEPSELEAFADCLARVDQSAESDYDLATSLWEQDLVHIDYEVADPFLEGEGGNAGDAFDHLRDTVLHRMKELGSTGGSGAGVDGTGVDGTGVDGAGVSPGAGDGQGEEGATTAEETDRRPRTVDPEDAALTAEEAQAAEWNVGDAAAVLDDFAVVLLEIAGDPLITVDADQKAFESLVLVVQQYLDDQNLDGLDLIVGRLDSLAEEGRRPPGYADGVLGRAATPERLAGLISSVQAGASEQQERIERFLKRMRSCAFPALLEILATSEDRTVRKLVLDLLRLTGGIPGEHLRPLMNDPRWYVVRNAVQLAADSGDPELILHMERSVRHPDARVRREVVRNIDSLGERRSVPLLVKALQDKDSAVRILAARSLGRLGDAGQFPAVHAQVQSRDFESRPAEEIEAFVTALARLGGDRSVETLNRFWKRRVFGTRPLALRLAAIQALGAAASPDATRAVSDATHSGETQIQRTALRVQAEIQARLRGGRS